MATVTVKKTTEYTLVLSDYEAEWLMQNMQNPLHSETPQTEDETDAKLRYSLFTTLKEAIYNG